MKIWCSECFMMKEYTQTYLSNLFSSKRLTLLLIDMYMNTQSRQFQRDFEENNCLFSKKFIKISARKKKKKKKWRVAKYQ